MQSAHELLEELAAPGRKLRDLIPDVYAGYAAQQRAAMTGEGELSPKMRELIALAIAVSKECDGCVAAHARKVAQHKATPQEVADALGVAILMNGGPGTTWAPRAFAAYQEFAQGQS
jgi:AhpD family alkylhydroperoxidase